MSKEAPTPLEARSKLEHYCAYQERCHQEVAHKLRSLGMDADQSDAIIVHLIAHDYLNESRFAQAFARGKHAIKFWGRRRIVNELKMRGISTYNINLALEEIDPERYETTFNALAERTWQNLREANLQRKKQKWHDILYRKGYESHLIMDKLQLLDS